MITEHTASLDLDNDENIDVLNDSIVEIIRKSAEVSVPMTRPSISKRLKPLPFWNDDIKKAIRAGMLKSRDRSRSRDQFLMVSVSVSKALVSLTSLRLAGYLLAF